jgi:hypothetical protein
MFADTNPLMKSVANVAEQICETRKPGAEDAGTRHARRCPASLFAWNLVDLKRIVGKERTDTGQAPARV